MDEQTRKSLAFVSDFLTFLFLDRGVAGRIASAYLFGSAVRGELGEGSDIDVFLECSGKDEPSVLKGAGRAEARFRASRDFEKWRGLDFAYPLSVKAGPLEEWGLKGSIAAEGMVVFSRSFSPKSLDRVVLFSLVLPKKKSAYLSLTRKLFGRRERHFKKDGVVDELGGKRVGSTAFLIPASAQQRVIGILHTRGVNFRMFELFRKA